MKLKEPKFLNAAELRGLTSAEQQALAELKRRAAAREPQTTQTSDGEAVMALPSDDKLLVVEIIVRRQTAGG